MIWGILEDVGAGKTLLMAYIGYNSYINGMTIMANFKLNFPYIPITSIQQLSNMEVDNRKLILLDELHASLDSRESMGANKRNILYARFLLQARKRKADVIFSNQSDFNIIDRRIRLNTMIWIKPSITLSYDEVNKRFTTNRPDKDLGIAPFLVSAVFYDKYLRPLDFEQSFMVYPAHMLYNTHEVVEETKTIDYDKLKDKYMKFNGTVSQLAAILHHGEHLTKADSNSFASFIIGVKANEYLKDLKTDLTSRSISTQTGKRRQT